LALAAFSTAPALARGPHKGPGGGYGGHHWWDNPEAQKFFEETTPIHEDLRLAWHRLQVKLADDAPAAEVGRLVVEMDNKRDLLREKARDYGMPGDMMRGFMQGFPSGRAFGPGGCLGPGGGWSGNTESRDFHNEIAPLFDELRSKWHRLQVLLDDPEPNAVEVGKLVKEMDSTRERIRQKAVESGMPMMGWGGGFHHRGGGQYGGPGGCPRRY
jgi:hypothetical protein